MYIYFGFGVCVVLIMSGKEYELHQCQKIKDVVNHPGVEQSMLTAYFEANRLHENARGLLDYDFLEYFTWQSNEKF
jgi:ATP-dependent DNA helicase PIF1